MVSQLVPSLPRAGLPPWSRAPATCSPPEVPVLPSRLTAGRLLAGYRGFRMALRRCVELPPGELEGRDTLGCHVASTSLVGLGASCTSSPRDSGLAGLGGSCTVILTSWGTGIMPSSDGLGLAGLMGFWAVVRASLAGSDASYVLSSRGLISVDS